MLESEDELELLPVGGAVGASLPPQLSRYARVFLTGGVSRA